VDYVDDAAAREGSRRTQRRSDSASVTCDEPNCNGVHKNDTSPERRSQEVNNRELQRRSQKRNTNQTGDRHSSPAVKSIAHDRID
jgi:hypothetical protein